ncbi:hypothetical protein FDK21_03680 [Cohaesibacter sp. CAU 1516]|nr:hypothetical protein FDK21_03680 [Cohaesibacter sp. CAU 1516]
MAHDCGSCRNPLVFTAPFAARVARWCAFVRADGAFW